MFNQGAEHMALIATKIALVASSAGMAAYSFVFGQTALDPNSSMYEKAIDGGASVLLLSIAAASMYALLQGRIVPIAAFEKRLTDIESDLKEIDASLKKTHESSHRVQETQDKAHHELKDMLTHITAVVDRNARRDDSQ